MQSLLAWLLVACSLHTATAHAGRGPKKGGRPAVEIPAADKLRVFGGVPEFRYVDQDGQPFGRKDLLGRTTIIDFIYTHCTTACPILSSKMMQLQRRITSPAARFVSISIDPAHDTPDVLKQYARRWTADASRWRLLSTDMATLPSLLRALRITREETDDEKDPIDHSSGFLLVDSTGMVRGIYSVEDPMLLDRLTADTELLAPALPPAAPAAEQGEQLFVSLGCAGCHAQVQVASPLAGVFGRMVKLADGTSVKADEAYLRESILSPAAKLAAGYGRTMPSYEGAISAPQLDALVQYVKGLKDASGAAAAAPRELVVDPVCKMEVSAGPEVEHVTHAGRVYYFCNPGCRQRFVKNPEHYLEPPKAR